MQKYQKLSIVVDSYQKLSIVVDSRDLSMTIDKFLCLIIDSSN